jgi:hypothetical protein
MRRATQWAARRFFGEFHGENRTQKRTSVPIKWTQKVYSTQVAPE